MRGEGVETHYTIKCRMSIGDSYHVCGWAKGEESLKELVERLKKTWRYVEHSSCLAQACETQPPKRKPRK